jgi:hypothetical protein
MEGSLLVHLTRIVTGASVQVSIGLEGFRDREEAWSSSPPTTSSGGSTFAGTS